MKKSKPAPVVFTTDNTGVSQILDDLVKSLPSSNNLTLNPPKKK